MIDAKIETFLAVCEHKSFTKAAEKLCLTQPAVSQHIHYLEKYYQSELFIRDGRNISLTAAGKLLFASARTMKNDEQRLLQQMHTAQSQKQYLFGATLTVAEFILSPILPRFIHAHPNDHIRMQVANTEALLSALESGEIDFAIVEGEFDRTQYDFLSFSEEEFVAVSTPGQAKLFDGAQLEQLLDQSLILREKGSGTRAILEAALEIKGISSKQFNNVVELGSIGAIKKALIATNQISFMYRAAIQYEEKTKQLACINIKGFPFYHEVCFVYQKRSTQSEHFHSVFKELISYR